jgi:hypothetical protein
MCIRDSPCAGTIGLLLRDKIERCKTKCQPNYQTKNANHELAQQMLDIEERK